MLMKPFIYQCRCGCGTWYLLMGSFGQEERVACDSWETAMGILEIINA